MLKTIEGKAHRELNGNRKKTFLKEHLISTTYKQRAMRKAGMHTRVQKIKKAVSKTVCTINPPDYCIHSKQDYLVLAQFKPLRFWEWEPTEKNF